MRLRDNLGLTFAPLCLRIVLGTTFLWAGLGKVVGTYEVQGQRAADLAMIGVPIPDAPPAADLPDTPPPAPIPDPEPADPAEDAPEEPAADTDSPSSLLPGAPAYAFTLVQDAPAGLTAADFPDPVEIRNLYGLSELIDDRANPGLDEDSRPVLALWPTVIGGKPWPVIFAWAAAITETVAGALLLLGLMTRLSALSIAGVMAAALWLTQIGPALQVGQARFGFLPAHDLWDIQAWTPLLWQFSLLGIAAALVLLGSGSLGLDRALFGGSPDEFARANKKASNNKSSSRDDTP